MTGSEISLSNQRPAQYVFDGQVQKTLTEMRRTEAEEKERRAAASVAAE